MTHAQFLQLAADYKLKHIGQHLLSTAVPGIRALKNAMRPAQSDDKTFIGGTPVPLPRDWPSYKETLLTFVAQVETGALPPDVCPTSLPDGILQFYVPSTPAANDYEPSLDSGRVIYVPTASSDIGGISKIPPIPESLVSKPTRPVQVPSLASRFVHLLGFTKDRYSVSQAKTHDKIFSKRSFEWEVFPTLHGAAPDSEALWLPENAERFEFDHDSDWDSYFEFRQAVMACPQRNWLVQMFGFANEQQDDMPPLVAVASGRRSFDEYREWILLFSLNSSCGGLAPEAACYYFWIHRDDLAEANFEEVWLCVQQD